MTLFPGDIVITGTPRGIAPMKSGDTVEVEIEGIGTLRNTVQAEDQLSPTN
jgi:2-keto-4-pentenoate hydratase/2-oxohepta-3-ene-1,7-dioic acid hydratase in catechol pathway